MNGQVVAAIVCGGTVLIGILILWQARWRMLRAWYEQQGVQKAEDYANEETREQR